MKLAYIVPGMGYTAAKPMLYYAKRLAEQAGYTVREVVYGDMSGIDGRTQASREAAYRIAWAAAEEQLSPQAMAAADDVLLISKSLGTYVAANWRQKYGIAARSLYFTPLQQTLELAGKDDMVIMGDHDPWADAAEARKAAEKAGFALFVIPGANHSLETGSCLEDMKNLQQAMAFAAGMMR